MEYKIVATLGPASADPALWTRMLAANVNAFRLNTSHLNLSELSTWLERLSILFETLSTPPALILDLQGSKWRLGDLPGLMLDRGDALELVFAERAAGPGILPVPHLDFFRAARQSSGEVVLNDAKVRLVLDGGSENRLSARVIQGGEISADKGITYTESGFRQENLSEKDQIILSQTRDLKNIRFAISYVKDAEEMEKYRVFSGAQLYLIAKLERATALQDADLIAQFVDELWICRGDLGAEMGLVGMARALASFSVQTASLGKPLFLAGQVFEHMKEQPAPTRSEVCYLYDALIKGYTGVVLSDETAVGKYPLESCLTAGMFLG